jgi:hypothetical protein
MKEIDIDNKNIISQKCYPTKVNLRNMGNMVNSVSNNELHRLLGVICCSGLRCGEAINSFIYYNDNHKLVFQSLLEKKRHYTKHRMPERGFLGNGVLKALLDRDVWKSAAFKFMFPGLEVGWMSDYVSEDSFTPTWLFEGCTYKKLYLELKKLPKMEVSYFRGEYMPSVKVKYMPSFHWFRKAFVAQGILTMPEHFKDPFQLVDYMSWDNVNELFSYYKSLDMTTTNLNSTDRRFHYRE